MAGVGQGWGLIFAIRDCEHDGSHSNRLWSYAEGGRCERGVSKRSIKGKWESDDYAAWILFAKGAITSFKTFDA